MVDRLPVALVAAAALLTGCAASASPVVITSPLPSPSHGVLDATLSADCVTPGAPITLTAHGRPGMQVLVNTLYADGKDGHVHGGFENRRRTGASGAYTLTWTLPAGAPVGDASVQAAAVDTSGSASHRLTFRIATDCA